MKKLLRFLRDYRKEAFLSPFFKMVEAIFELLVPLAVAAIVDNGIGRSDTAFTIKMVIVMACLAVVGLISSLTAQYFAAKAAINFTAKVRHALFEHIQKLSYTQLDQLGSPTLITRLTSDLNQLQNGVNMTLRLFLRSPFIVFGAMIMAFTIDKHAALIFVGTIILLSVVVFGIMLICIPLYEKIQRSLDDVLLTARENLSGVRVIRAFCREQAEEDEFKDKNDFLTSLQNFTGRISALMNPLTLMIVNAAIIILIYVGAVQVNTGALTTGAVVALYNYLSQILVELIKLANLIISITKSAACGDRVEAILEIEPDMTFPDETAEPSKSEYFVELDHVSLRYKGAAKNSLSDISLKVRRGETIGIIGGTGSGKTSLVNIIARFYDVTEGEIRIGGVDIKKYSRERLRSFFGIVPQKATLFKGSVRENIKWGKPDADDTEIMNALESAQAKEFIEKNNDGLDHMIDQNGRNLSGGQRQRMTIARALVGDPDILILDDSSSALDFATDAALRRALRNNFGDKTVFIVSQRASSIMYADQIVVLDDGEAVGIGTHDKLIKDCGVYKEIYDSQYKKEAVS